MTVDRSLARSGQSAVLRRVIGTGEAQTFADVTLRTFIRDFAPADLPQGLPQGTSEVRISNTEISAAAWPGPPRTGDRLIANGRTRVVEACETRRKGEAIAMHVLQVVGG
ncbi:hypothetical protein [Falsiroseomonas sp.]|uniref:hypothetical protein n=1 Tax=Falsiroseomonas sp. TaxID=2870721 RepID=UPI002736E930|nr:hypothetical protein [Falsiroseomonas sp.]MDP3417855.1 hypothetical protein [Falsiroseomonas sp.]